MGQDLQPECRVSSTPGNGHGDGKSPGTEAVPCSAEEKKWICWVSPLNRFAAFRARGSEVRLFQVPRQQIFSPSFAFENSRSIFH